MGTVATPTLTPPATPAFPPPPPSPLLALPELLSPLSLEATPLLDVTSPTLPESSTSPRGRPRLMPRLTPTTLSDTMVWDTLDTPATPTPDSATTMVSATDTTPTLLLLPLLLPLPPPSRLRPPPSLSPLPSSTTPLLLATPMSPLQRREHRWTRPRRHPR